MKKMMMDDDDDLKLYESICFRDKNVKLIAVDISYSHYWFFEIEKEIANGNIVIYITSDINSIDLNIYKHMPIAYVSSTKPLKSLRDNYGFEPDILFISPKCAVNS